MATDVITLKQFMDKYLITNPVGNALVKTYYTLSPRCAEFIEKHPWLRAIVRAQLKPIVKISKLLVED